jgi:hypothetical protein
MLSNEDAVKVFRDGRRGNSKKRFFMKTAERYIATDIISS